MKRYTITLTREAEKQLSSLPRRAQESIRDKIDGLVEGLSGDVKRLKSFSPAYRLRVGDYRVLFDVEDDRVSIAMIGHRREIYDR